MVSVRLIKFDAIKAQLDAAIELFFKSDNVVATHTLAAAYNALKDIAKCEGAAHPFIKTKYIPSLPEAARNRMFKQVNEPENFFKHADRDPSDEILFNPDLTELLLIDACAYFRESDIEKPRHYYALLIWTGKTKDEIPNNSNLRLLMDVFRDVLKSKGKREFWVMYNQHISSRYDI
ncbi:MAG: hypothetical protein JSS37_08185 [Proteobacteria bacterium]|nr:hypothetical protein [Pseudomonadota bacterium]